MSTQQLSGSVVAGHYRLEAPLGSGGFGTVHRAVDLRIDRRVAVKLLRRELMGSGDVEARFMREAELARRLEHPNTVRLLDFGRTDGTPFLVYELLVGESLGELLARQGALPVERVTHIGMQLLKSLSEAHTLGIVHRDIKPANIFLTNFAGASDFLKVLDFGIAKAPSEQMTVLTQTGVTIGTPSYMAPEQVRSQPVGPAADLYAVGLVLAEALTGRVIVWNQTPLLTAMEQIAERPVPLPPEVIASKLGPVLQRATQKSVEYRYGSAQQMLADLEAAAAGLLTAQMPPAPMAQAPTAPRGNPFAAHAIPPVQAQPLYAQPVAPRKSSNKGIIVGVVLAFGAVLIAAIVTAALLRDRGTEKKTASDEDKKRPEEPASKQLPRAPAEPAPLAAPQHDELHRRIEAAGFKITSHRMDGGRPVVSTDVVTRDGASCTLVVSDLGNEEAARREVNNHVTDAQFVGAALREGTHVLVVRVSGAGSGSGELARQLVHAIAQREPDVLRAAAGAPATTATPSVPTSQPTASPVASGGVPAKCADVCTRLGRCTASGDRCIVGSDADCRGSNQCGGLGKCIKLGDACAAKSESDCRNATQCRTAGVCTHVANINVCLATSKADCEASTRCKTDGNCSAGSGSCVPLTEAECQASQRCKTEGICSLAGNTCVKK